MHNAILYYMETCTFLRQVLTLRTKTETCNALWHKQAERIRPNSDFAKQKHVYSLTAAAWSLHHFTSSSSQAFLCSDIMSNTHISTRFKHGGKACFHSDRGVWGENHTLFTMLHRYFLGWRGRGEWAKAKVCIKWEERPGLKTAATQKNDRKGLSVQNVLRRWCYWHTCVVCLVVTKHTKTPMWVSNSGNVACG